MFLGVEGLCKNFEGTPVLRDVCFELAKGEIASFVGPSGVGKTTLLKILAGLDTADSGMMRFETAPSKEHPVIMVFQDYQLFPTLSVFENVAFGLRARKMAKQEISDKVRRFLDYFQLHEKASAFPAQLSAGQKQRVALARAMVISPMLLLLDEPFANLDRNLKMQTAEFIRETQKEFGVTTIAVTHDQEEAFAMSDRIGVVLDGRLKQFDTAAEVYARPASLEVARFLGPVNELSTECAGFLGMDEAVCWVRPEMLRLELAADGFGTVEEVKFFGHYSRYVVRAGSETLTVYAANAAVRAGERVNIRLRTGENS